VTPGDCGRDGPLSVARKLQKTLAMKTATFVFALLVAGTANAQVHLDVTIGGKTLDVRDATNKVLASYQISPGLPKHPTPTGNFAIRKIVWNPAWVPPKAGWAKGKKATSPTDPKNPMKVVKIFFREPDYYIHGTWDINSLGKAESHGCLRMDPEHVAEVARFLMEHGGQPRDENWFWRIIHFNSDEKSIYLKNPVPLEIQS